MIICSAPDKTHALIAAVIFFIRNRLKSVFRAVLHAFHAKNAFRSVYSLSRIIRYIHIHGAHPPALTAGHTFFLITFDPQKGEITHWFQKNSDRTDIFTKCPVIFEHKGQGDADPVICEIARDECPKHNAFDIPDFSKE